MPEETALMPRCKQRLDESVHAKYYASSRLEAAGRAKLAKGAAAICGAKGQRLDQPLPVCGGGREPPQGAVLRDRRRGGVL